MDCWIDRGDWSKRSSLPKEKKVRVVRYTRRRSLRDLFQSPWQAAFPGNHMLALLVDQFEIR